MRITAMVIKMPALGVLVALLLSVSARAGGGPPAPEDLVKA